MTMFNNPTVPTSLDALSVGRTSSSPFITTFETRDPTTNDVNYPIQTRWINTSIASEWILLSYVVVGGIKTANWELLTNQSVSTETLTGNSGGPVGVDGLNNINVVGDGMTIEIVGNPGTNTLTASTTGAVATLYTENTGIATPAAGNLNVVGTGSITTVGTGSTITAELTGLTNHSLLVGAGTPTITSLGVATNGQLPIGSTGANPVLAPLTAGTNVTITNGAGSITVSSPTTFSQTKNQVFTTSGTYTPTAGMKFASIQVVGGGGGSAGCPATSPGLVAGAGSGGGGGYASGIFTSVSIGASQAVTIGAGGTGGAIGANVGNAGGTTSVGALISSTGGGGGDAGGATTVIIIAGGSGGVGSGGDFQTIGTPGGISFGSVSGSFVATAGGGCTFFGGGGSSTGIASIVGTSVPAVAATSYGGGATGGASFVNTSGQAGANGFQGIVIITEYI